MTISLSLDIEAESLEEAMDKASDCPIMNLCHQCADVHEGEWCTSGELDGDVKVLPVDQAYELEN